MRLKPRRPWEKEYEYGDGVGRLTTFPEMKGRGKEDGTTEIVLAVNCNSGAKAGVLACLCQVFICHLLAYLH